MLGLGVGIWAGVIGRGGGAAPVPQFTGPSSFIVVENTPPNFIVTFNALATRDFLYGRDAANWEVVEDGPSYSFTVRRAGGGSFDFEDPVGTTVNGANLTNSHDIIIIPKSPSGALGTEVPVTFNITDQDEEPDVRTWATQTNATLNQTYRPNLQQITGLDDGVVVSFEPQGGSKWAKGTSATPPAAGAYTSAKFNLTNGDWVGPENTAGGANNLSNTVTAKVSQQTFSFTVATPVTVSATLSPTDKNAGQNLSNGNLTAIGTAAGGNQGIRANQSRAVSATSTATFTVDQIANGSGTNLYWGLVYAAQSLSASPTGATGPILAFGTWGWQILNNGSVVEFNYTVSFAVGAVAKFTLTGGAVQFYINNVARGAPQTPPAGTGDLFAYFNTQDASGGTADFGSY